MDKWWAIRWKREIQFTPPYLGIRSHAEEQPLSVQFRMRILVVFPSLYLSASLHFSSIDDGTSIRRWRRRRCDGGRYYYSTFELPVRATNSRNHSHVPPLPVPVYLPSCPYATQPSIVFPLQSHNLLITVLLRWLHRYTLPGCHAADMISLPSNDPSQSIPRARERAEIQAGNERNYIVPIDWKQISILSCAKLVVVLSLAALHPPPTRDEMECLCVVIRICMGIVAIHSFIHRRQRQSFAS